MPPLRVSDVDSYGPMLGHHLLNAVCSVGGTLEVMRSGEVDSGVVAELLDRAQAKVRLISEAARLLTSGDTAAALAVLAGGRDPQLVVTD